MKFSVVPEGVCSRRIDFEIVNGSVHNVKFTGGCPGNLKAVSTLVEGMSVDDLYNTLSGITCGNKPTSCCDQLAQAVFKAANSMKKKI